MLRHIVLWIEKYHEKIACLTKWLFVQGEIMSESWHSPQTHLHMNPTLPLTWHANWILNLIFPPRKFLLDLCMSSTLPAWMTQRYLRFTMFVQSWTQIFHFKHVSSLVLSTAVGTSHLHSHPSQKLWSHSLLLHFLNTLDPQYSCWPLVAVFFNVENLSPSLHFWWPCQIVFVIFWNRTSALTYPCKNSSKNSY